MSHQATEIILAQLPDTKSAPINLCLGRSVHSHNDCTEEDENIDELLDDVEASRVV